MHQRSKCQQGFVSSLHRAILQYRRPMGPVLWYKPRQIPHRHLSQLLLQEEGPQLSPGEPVSWHKLQMRPERTARELFKCGRHRMQAAAVSSLDLLQTAATAHHPVQQVPEFAWLLAHLGLPPRTHQRAVRGIGSRLHLLEGFQSPPRQSSEIYPTCQTHRIHHSMISSATCRTRHTLRCQAQHQGKHFPRWMKHSRSNSGSVRKAVNLPV
mmetsp:Transcript_32245/g.75744  ORF Transcript_32245/g.75744 Transcript_32245/m.75744 type:complete len:211 (-) Transcript_32245:1295-1927(-)